MFFEFILIDTENYKNKGNKQTKTLLKHNNSNLNSCTKTLDKTLAWHLRA